MKQAKLDYICAVISEKKHPGDVRCRNRRKKFARELCSPWVKYVSGEDGTEFVRKINRRYGICG